MISIIIPTFNEEQNIRKTINHILSASQYMDYEIIIADGGSNDKTVTIAEDTSCRVVQTLPGRGIQLNAGANIARGNVLLFLHADTLLPTKFDEIIINTIINKNIPVWGRFDVKLSGKHWLFRVIERFISLRSRLTGIATGDQAIFITSQLFSHAAGYKNIPLMEDIEITRRLKKITPPVCLSHKVTTSSRRWEDNGIIKTVLLMWMLRLLYYFGVSPGKLKKLYI